MNRLQKWLPDALVAVVLLGPILLVFIQVYAAADGQTGAIFWFRTYPGLIVALASGFFGATFSMLVQAQRRTSEGTLEDLGSACAWRTLGVRASVGLGGAAILYFFFRSGLLEGSLWPDLSRLGYDALASGDAGLVPNQHWCLLVIWCFLGGFSETLVPNILTKTEQKASISAS
jgi:hypothetical protein